MIFTKMQFHPILLAVVMYITGWLWPIKELTYYQIGNMFLFWTIIYATLDIILFIIKRLYSIFKCSRK